MQVPRSILALSLLATASVAQSTIVSPVGNAAVEGNSNNVFPFNSVVRRYMQIHGDLGTAPMLITKLSFRVNASTTNYIGTRTYDMELFMGEANSNAVTAPSLTYANNYYLPPTLVIPRTMITFGPTGQAVSPGPNPFINQDLPLVTPFPYTAAYPLIWEVPLYGATAGGTISAFDADSTSLTSGAQVITGTGCVASTQTTTLMTHTVTCADVGGILHFGVTVTAGPNSAPCLLSVGLSNPNLAVPGLCSNLLTDLFQVMPYGVTSATGTITGDALPFYLLIPNTLAGGVIFTQVHAIDLGRTDPYPVTNSNGRQVTFPAINVSHVNAVTRLWNNVGGATGTQAFFTTSVVGYGLVTQFTY